MAFPRRLIIIALAFGTSLIAAAPAQATPIALDGSWILLDDFMNPGSFFTGAGDGVSTLKDATTWDWTSPNPVRLTITDYFVPADHFNLYDNGTLYGTVIGGTPWQLIPGCNGNPWSASCHWTGDPDVAFADPAFPSAIFLLAPGSHSIAIQSIGIPVRFPDSDTLFGDSTAAFNLQPVPEPASLVLTGTGLLGLAHAVRARRKSETRGAPGRAADQA